MIIVNYESDEFAVLTNRKGTFFPNLPADWKIYPCNVKNLRENENLTEVTGNDLKKLAEDICKLSPAVTV